MVQYKCPECGGDILLNGYVVLSVKKRSGERGLVMLDAKPDGYNMIEHSTLNFKKGEILEIFCPICHYNLICIPDKNLAKVMLEDETGELLTILFSVVFGEKKSYVVSENQTKAFGKKKLIDFETLSLLK